MPLRNVFVSRYEMEKEIVKNSDPGGVSLRGNVSIDPMNVTSRSSLIGGSLVEALFS